MNIKQLQASNPRNSVWVSASAGTGKTKVLTDRLLRLLLDDVAIEKLLCLTFTNAAAKEMQERIKSKLFTWSSMPVAQLKQELSSIATAAISDSQLHKARGLYMRLLQHEDKLNIYTIHAFCQKILKQFSFEAGITPDASIIDEITYDQVINNIKQQIWQDEALKPLTNFMLANFHDITIAQLFKEIIADRLKFGNLDAKFEGIHNIIDKITYEDKAAYQLLSCQPEIQHYFGVSLDKAQLKAIFLTTKGERKKRILPKSLAPDGSDLQEKLKIYQEQIFLLDQRERKAQTKAFAELIQILASQIIGRYNKYKKQHSLLDYDDLIELTSNLLSSNDERAWVLYKLDGGVDHILVDEAQDTSPSQWQIIQALIEEFFAGNSKDEGRECTLFVVGDEKQSIFSFQGADLATFQKMNHFAGKMISNSGAKLSNIDLAISYRSSPAILHFVEQVFTTLKRRDKSLFDVKMKNIKAHRQQNYGRVSLWPITKRQESDPIFWQYKPQEQQDAASCLANEIASYIKQQLQTKRVLPATSQPISEGDFMLLFRSRDAFTYKVMKALDRAGLQNTGLDRLMLKDELILRDIIAIAVFVQNPYDDLNLASLLKAPYFNLSESELYQICTNRPKDSYIWQYLQTEYQQSKILEQLQFFQRCNNKYPLEVFFSELLHRYNFLQLLLNHHGQDAKEVVYQFLYLVNKFCLNHSSSLTKFTSWFLKNETEIKRQDAEGGKIRIMTVHGSKGLQAPIVILCDTTTLPTNKDRLYWYKNALNCYFKSGFVPDDFKKITDSKKHAMLEEYMRLFYVALTRAEDELIICGHSNRQNLPDNCWYSLAQAAMTSVCHQAEEDGSLTLAKEDNYNFADMLTGHAGMQAAPKTEAPSGPQKDTLPDFVNSCMQQNEVIEEIISRKKRTNYGIIFHKIMEEAARRQNPKLLLGHPLIKALNMQEQQRYHQEAQKILANTEFCNLLEHQDCYPELELVYGSKVGRIDLMVKLAGQKALYIIDYKTDTSYYEGAEVPAEYKRQLRTYHEASSHIFRGYKIICYLLWASSGVMQEVGF